MTRPTLVLAAGLVATASPTWAAFTQALPVGAELQVNTYTTDAQRLPAVGADPAGGFVVVWESAGADGSGSGISGQRYDAAGTPVGGEFQVNDFTTTSQIDPSVAVGADGGFVVTWASAGQGEGATFGIFARRFDAGGTALGGDLHVNTYVTSNQLEPSVAVDGAGNFVVVWRSDGQDGSGEGIFGQRFDADGVPLGGEFPVNTVTTDDQSEARVAANAAGDFVVVWETIGADEDVAAQRFDASGAPMGGEFVVNTYTTGFQYHPDVTADAAGNFVVVWTHNPSETLYTSVFAQRYDAAGAALGGAFAVNAYTTGTSRRARVAAGASDGFVVAWGGREQDGDAFGVSGRRFVADGTAIGDEFPVNTHTTGRQADASVAVAPDGGFLVAWQSDDQDGSDTGVFAQRFAAPRTILGKRVLVRDPNGAEIRRGVLMLGKETATDVGPTIVGDPAADGATLRIVTRGTTESDQAYVLDASGWSPLGSVGWRYAGPTAGDGDPVRKVLLKRTPSGRTLLKVLVKGNVGTQDVEVVPPNAGDEAGLVLAIGGGGTYCVGFGGAAGGSEKRDTEQVWKLVNPSAEPGCPAP